MSKQEQKPDIFNSMLHTFRHIKRALLEKKYGPLLEIDPEEGHVHEYKPYDPLMEKLHSIENRLERIERHLGVVAKGGGPG